MLSTRLVLSIALLTQGLPESAFSSFAALSTRHRHPSEWAMGNDKYEEPSITSWEQISKILSYINVPVVIGWRTSNALSHQTTCRQSSTSIRFEAFDRRTYDDNGHLVV